MFALIDDKDMVGQLLVAISEEDAQYMADNVFYGIKTVVEVTDQENADKVAIGCGWDGEAFVPHAGTDLDVENPTRWEADPVAE